MKKTSEVIRALRAPLTGIALAITTFAFAAQPVSESCQAIIDQYGVDPYDRSGLLHDGPVRTDASIFQAPVAEDMVWLHRGGPSKTLPENPRMIAEWEPVQGALVRYPLGIHVNAVKTIASEIATYVICSSGEQSSASSAFQRAGVNMDNIKFISAKTDSYWTRDYAPWWIEAGPEGSRKKYIVDVIYRRDRPNDDKVPSVVAGYLNMPTYYYMDYTCQGGNIMCDGAGVGASTDRIVDENKGKSLQSMITLGKNITGFNPYYVITDPNSTYIKHIDCWAKFIPGNKVLVKRIPQGSKDYNKVEKAAQEWAQRKNVNGEPFEVIRIDAPADGPYVNHVVINDRVLVPAVGSSADKIAIDQIQAAYGSDYRVIGVPAAPGKPWLGTDSIHCRVNTIPTLE